MCQILYVIYICLFFLYVCFFQIPTCHHDNGIHTCVKLYRPQISGEEWVYTETMNASFAPADTSRLWYPSTLRLPHSFAHFLLLALPLKKDHNRITLPPSFWRQLKFPGNCTEIWILETKFLFSVQDRPRGFWRNGCVEIIISPPLLLSPVIPHSIPPSPRGTNWWRDEGESQDKDKN